MIRFLFLILPFFAFALPCKEYFSFQSNGLINSREILEEIAKSCQFSLIYTDNLSYEILSNTQPNLHINNLSAKKFLEILLDHRGLHYTSKDFVLKISFLSTQTYDLNYVSTARMSSNNTDVTLTQSPNFNPSAHLLGNENLPLGGGSGKSGSKIYSRDEVNFWGEIEKEISSIAYRSEDLFFEKIPQNITINKNAGLITITASNAQHARIRRYLEKLHQKMHAQVLIDVHIFTIRHFNSQTAGINWNELYNLNNLTIPSIGNTGASFLQLGKNGMNVELNIFSQGVTLSRIVEFLQTYGKTQSLSNPKILTLNNQPALISVGSVLRYIQNSVYQSSSQGNSIQNSTENYPSIFAGVLLDVTPSIQGEEIILKINPSITRTKNTEVENEPNALKTPPNLSTNQLSSMVKVKSGEKIILGGLISNISSKKEFKIPLLGDIPILEYLFKYKWNSNSKEEMVIIISPKIIHSPTSLNQNTYTEIGKFNSDFKSLLKQIKEEELLRLYTPSNQWKEK
ncbi:pilus (MSHA type) biogenesis protein MshL [Helicobacter cholecystus]|uniref:Pilus (MSHA type) biogenesis protein MshL n=1 Tax=Helicobacter cholecystus TaxID=45498 RepID=A0A3D8IT75_9HELI|nr:pilus (MSHA type) biogenesis protein MshL [Helicobacter cholecystus]RDU68146.1 pilus (MSHA type) biogenesis protein MshL [Helicobacter cholecystus]VEJ24524.1 Pullulanase secretion envelope pulD [Helicobacter cholecystus]